MQEVVLASVLVVYLLHGLPRLQQIVVHEQVECFCLIQVDLLLDHHDQLVDVERLQNQDPTLRLLYLLLLTSFSLDLGALRIIIGTLSEWNFFIISASFISSASVSYSRLINIYNWMLYPATPTLTSDSIIYSREPSARYRLCSHFLNCGLCFLGLSPPFFCLPFCLFEGLWDLPNLLGLLGLLGCFVIFFCRFGFLLSPCFLAFCLRILDYCYSALISCSRFTSSESSSAQSWAAFRASSFLFFCISFSMMEVLTFLTSSRWGVWHC